MADQDCKTSQAPKLIIFPMYPTAMNSLGIDIGGFYACLGRSQVNKVQRSSIIFRFDIVLALTVSKPSAAGSISANVSFC